MKNFLTLLLLAAMALTAARAQDSTVIYDDALQNGWVSYGWATLNFSNSNPIHGGNQSISVTDPTSNYEALYLHHDEFDSTPYQSISFWINGGATGGQKLVVTGQLNGVAQTPVPLATLSANTWQQITLTLSSLGVANQSNFDGFWIQNNSGAPAPTFYVDDVVMTAVPPPTQVQVSINANSVIRTIDERMYGINVAMWDSLLSGPDNDGLLAQMGTRIIRFPGGSLSDDYNWQTDRQVSTGGPFQWPNNAATFATVAEKRGAQAYVTVNYGSGTPEQAAAWVAYYNALPGNTTTLGTDSKGRNWNTAGFWATIRASAPLTTDDGYNFLRIAHAAPFGLRYWEVGNEIYGSWEYDQHGTAGSGLAGSPNDAATYATAFKDFYAKMLAVDPAIKIGAVFDPAFVTQLALKSATPHFIIYHRYPQNSGGENDATLLSGASGIGSDATLVRNAVNSAFGATKGNAMELAMTELNSTSSGVGKQSVSLVNGLFMADSLGFIARSEFNACVWWDLRNSSDSGTNNSDSLYGWRKFGDYGVLATGDRGDTPANTPYPTFYASKLLTHWARGGDQVIAASSDFPLLSVHAAHLANGNLALLVVNRSATTDLGALLNLSGYSPDASATVYQYGKSNDLANGDLTTTTISNASGAFAYTFPSYSMTVMLLHVAGTTPPPDPPPGDPGTTPPPTPPALTMTSAPVAAPDPADIGATVSFTAAASGTHPIYTWNFGDGSTGSSSASTHVYSTAGTFTAVVTITDDTGSTITGSTDVHVSGADAVPLFMTKLSVKINFAKANQDAIAFSGTLPVPAGFAVNGQSVSVNVGGIIKAFALNAKGVTPRGNDTFKLVVKAKRKTISAQNAAFSAAFKKGSFAAALSPFGLSNAAATRATVMIPVTITFNQNLYSKNESLLYTAKAGKTGTAK